MNPDRFEAILSRGEIFIDDEPAGLIADRARRRGLIWMRGDRYREGCADHECLEAAKAAGLIRPLTQQEIRQRIEVTEQATNLTQAPAVD